MVKFNRTYQPNDNAAPEKGGAQRPSISIVYDYGDESHSPDAPGTV